MKIIKPHNPFLVAGYFNPEYFCDRETETKKIISALDNDRSISLLSPRRYGKTGLIKHVFYHITERDKNVTCIYLDIFSTQNLNDFVKVFAENILGKIDDSVESKLKHFVAFFKSFRPTLSFDALSGSPEISVKIEPESVKISLQEVFAYLKELNKRIYIAIDEFQQVANYPEKGTEALLRSYIQFLPNVKFIFSGSRLHMMNEIFLSPKRPFYQSTQIMSLGTIPAETYLAFSCKHFLENGYTISKECFDYLYSKFEGHTWYIQSILNRLYEYREDINDISIVNYCIRELLDENQYSYQELLNAYSSVQVNLLRAVAVEKVVARINSGDFISKHKLKNASSISRSLSKLIDNELIYKSENGFIVYDRFLSIWLEKNNKQISR